MINYDFLFNSFQNVVFEKHVLNALNCKNQYTNKVNFTLKIFSNLLKIIVNSQMNKIYKFI